MKDRNIFAHTAPGSNFPEYLSINRRNEQIVVTVRTTNGPTAEMMLPDNKLDELIYALRGARPANLFGSASSPTRLRDR